MSNEGQLHQLPFIVVQKAAGPQVGEAATHIKQEAKGWLFVPLPPIPKCVTILGPQIKL